MQKGLESTASRHDFGRSLCSEISIGNTGLQSASVGAPLIRVNREELMKPALGALPNRIDSKKSNYRTNISTVLDRARNITGN